MTFRLIYESRGADTLTESELRIIAMFSAMWNKDHGISGLLLHHEGRILQVLEGPEADVKALFSKIEADNRHHSVHCLFAQECASPAFDEWSMGYRPVETAPEIDMFFSLSKSKLADITAQTSAQSVKETLENYQEHMGPNA